MELYLLKWPGQSHTLVPESRCIENKARDQAAPLSILGIKEAYFHPDTPWMGYVCMRQERAVCA